MQINISILQASLTEERIAFHAIDRVKELTCVSVLAACLDNIQCRILMNNVSHKTLEPLSDSSPDSGTKKPLPSEVTRKQGSLERDTGASNMEQSEMVEKQQEDMVGSLGISRIHCQLRRMKKDSNFSDHVTLTAIPEHRSKVLFTFQKQNVFQLLDRERDFPPTYPSKLESLSEDDETAEDIAGFIMFECGLEDINLKAARRSGYETKSSSTEEDNPQGEAKTHKAPPETKPSSHHSEEEHSGQDEEDGNTADDEASIPSRYSVASNAGSDVNSRDVDSSEGAAMHEELQGDASSCVLEFKTVWFNFAAPPPSPKKKKLEFTR